MAKKKEPKNKKKLLALLLIVVLLWVIFAYTLKKRIETTPLKEIVENKSVVIEGIVSFELSSNILVTHPDATPYFLVGPERVMLCAYGFDNYQDQYIIANVTYSSRCVSLISILGKKDCINLNSKKFENYTVPSSEDNKLIWTRSGKYYCP